MHRSTEGNVRLVCGMLQQNITPQLCVEVRQAQRRFPADTWGERLS